MLERLTQIHLLYLALERMPLPRRCAFADRNLGRAATADEARAGAAVGPVAIGVDDLEVGWQL